MKFNFDEIVVRRGSNSYKWDSDNDPEMIPMWVADMDFKTAPPIIEALNRRVQHGVFGYARVPDAYYDAIISWFERRHQFRPERNRILYSTGVVPAISATILALTSPGDKIIVQEPVYNCFFSSIRNNRCEAVSNDLVYSGERYTINFEDLEAKATDPKTRLMLLCNPHNPVGRVWTKEELERIGDICYRNKVMVLADEIHGDLVHPVHTYIPFASLGRQFSEHSVTFSAPGKTFNLAGLQLANIFCSDAEVRRRIDKAININEVCDISPFAVEGLLAAYTHPDSERWLEALKTYLWNNYIYARDFLSVNFPQLKVMPLEATYLMWIDCSVMKISSEKLAALLLEEAKVRINSGSIYGKNGEGFIRLNIACPQSILQEGLYRMKNVLDKFLNESGQFSRFLQ